VITIMDILRRPLPIFFVVDAKPYHCLCQYQAALLHPPSFFTPHAPPIDHLIPFPLRPGFLEQSHQRSASAEWSVLASNIRHDIIDKLTIHGYQTARRMRETSTSRLLDLQSRLHASRSRTYLVV
jgi:hypothetical protein